jgi:hypothetical protein
LPVGISLGTKEPRTRFDGWEHRRRIIDKKEVEETERSWEIDFGAHAGWAERR